MIKNEMIRYSTTPSGGPALITLDFEYGRTWLGCVHSDPHWNRLCLECYEGLLGSRWRSGRATEAEAEEERPGEELGS